MKTRTNILLLDDHPVLLRGLEELLSGTPGIHVAGSFCGARDFMAKLAMDPGGIDAAIVDYALGPDDVDCRNLLAAMRRRFPEVPVLVLSAQHNAVTVAAALKAGARGFLSKSSGPVEIVGALTKLRQGALALEGGMVDALTEMVGALPSPQHSGADPLSPREREVLVAVLEGLTTGQIATRYRRAPCTISAQKKSGYRKLGVRNNSELFNMRHLLGLE